jgi:hypothetical protein
MERFPLIHKPFLNRFLPFLYPSERRQHPLASEMAVQFQTMGDMESWLRTTSAMVASSTCQTVI